MQKGIAQTSPIKNIIIPKNFGRNNKEKQKQWIVRTCKICTTRSEPTDAEIMMQTLPNPSGQESAKLSGKAKHAKTMDFQNQQNLENNYEAKTCKHMVPRRNPRNNAMHEQRRVLMSKMTKLRNIAATHS